MIPAQRHRVVPAQLACRIGARAQAGERNAWPAVVPIALGSFAPVFSEVIPVGLLADISGQLRVSIGTGGPMVVVPAVAAAVAAGVTVRSHLRATLMGSGLLIAASALLLAAVTGARPLTSRWWPPGGLGFGAVPVAAQSWMARAMPSNIEGGLALLSPRCKARWPQARRPTGVIYDASGPGGALVLAAAVAAGSLALLGRAGAAISAPSAGPADLAHAGPGSARTAARHNRWSRENAQRTR